MNSIIVGIVKSIYKPLIALVCVILFFISYNTYLVDHSLDNLRLALTQTASAQTLEQVQSLQGIIDYALISELTAYKMNSGNIADLTLSRNILTKGKSEMQIKDVELALKEIIKRREGQRGSALTALDKFINGFKGAKNRLARLFITERPAMEIAIDASFLLNAAALEEELRFREAIENYKLFIAGHPDYKNIDEVRLKLAYCYERIKDYSAAQKIYERIVKLSGPTQEAQIALAGLTKLKEIQNLLKERSDLVARIKKLTTVSQLQPAYFQLATIDTKLMDFALARENYQKAMELDPDTELALKAKYNLGWAYKLENKVEESLSVFQELARETPASELALNSKYQIADNLRLQGKYEEALGVYKEISQQHSKKILGQKAQFQAGYTYLYYLGDPQAAKREIDKSQLPMARTYIKDVGKEHRLRGYGLLRDKSYHLAMERFETAVKLNPKDSSAYDGMARVYRALGKLEEAIKTAQQGSQVNPQDEYIFATLGELYTACARHNDAIYAYRRAVEINDRYVEALYNLGYLYNLNRQYDAAISVLEKAVKALPSYAEAYNNLGVAYWNKGRVNDAIRSYKNAVNANPAYLDALYNLGLIYKSQGQYEQARDIFGRILKVSPSDMVAKKELKELEGRQ